MEAAACRWCPVLIPGRVSGLERNAQQKGRGIRLLLWSPGSLCIGRLCPHRQDRWYLAPKVLSESGLGGTSLLAFSQASLALPRFYLGISFIP